MYDFRTYTESVAVDGTVVGGLSWQLNGESTSMQTILAYIFTSWEDALDVSKCEIKRYLLVLFILSWTVCFRFSRCSDMSQF